MLTPIIVPNYSDCEYDRPTRPQSALEWHCHFGLLRVYLNVVHWCVAIFWSSCTTPFAWGTYGIVAKNLLQLTNGPRSCVFNLLAKCNAISLLKFFNNFTKIEIRQLLKTTSSLVGLLTPVDRKAIDAFRKPEKIHDCTRVALVYARKNKVWYFLNTLRILGRHFYKSAQVDTIVFLSKLSMPHSRLLLTVVSNNTNMCLFIEFDDGSDAVLSHW